MNIQLTENAAQHIRKMLATQDDAIGLRLGTKKSGCTGFAYVVDYADGVNEHDRVFENRGVKLVVDEESLPLLDGLELDFTSNNLLNQGFEFHNPNVKDTCGCGESFNV
ncbi:MAG TPA: iron-sulfur cluster assembly accessory protein [Thiolapillus brandeum]|uniref:Iron-sulfur cluster assembly accessory protein n=1 Tax=Thiolapillus brandeum TaxID=1076588 RepID=A0A831WGF5_9GAMM|nr:iron-sulfur cluster assembly accessory protein [Thiolapillus brandeum]